MYSAGILQTRCLAEQDRGSSDSSTAIGILQSLKDAGYETNESLTKMYTDYRADRPTIAMAQQDWTLPEPTKDYYTDSLMDEAKEYSDTAVVVIGRSGGEGADLPTDMKSVIDGSYAKMAEEVSVSPDNYGYVKGSYTNNGDYDDFDEGESYLELSNTEEDMLDTVCSQFDNVIVVVNANNAMELDWVDKYEQIGAVIFAPGAGATGFRSTGRDHQWFCKPIWKNSRYLCKGSDRDSILQQYGSECLYKRRRSERADRSK